MKHSPYLATKLRTEQEARADCNRAVENNAFLFGDPARPYRHDYEATKRAEQHRKVSALTHELRNAVEDREAENRPIDLQERADLIALRSLIDGVLNKGSGW